VTQPCPIICNLRCISTLSWIKRYIYGTDWKGMHVFPMSFNILKVNAESISFHFQLHEWCSLFLRLVYVKGHNATILQADRTEWLLKEDWHSSVHGSVYRYRIGSRYGYVTSISECINPVSFLGKCWWRGKLWSSHYPCRSTSALCHFPWSAITIWSALAWVEKHANLKN